MTPYFENDWLFLNILNNFTPRETRTNNFESYFHHTDRDSLPSSIHAILTDIDDQFSVVFKNLLRFFYSLFEGEKKCLFFNAFN